MRIRVFAIAMMMATSPAWAQHDHHGQRAEAPSAVTGGAVGATVDDLIAIAKSMSPEVQISALEAEAALAKVDGAGWWTRFWHVTLPMLRPTLVFVVVMSVINSFQVFDQAYIMTGGTSEGVGGVLDGGLTLVSYLYEQGFQKFRMGYASAIAYLMFGCVLGLTLINIRMLRASQK